MVDCHFPKLHVKLVLNTASLVNVHQQTPTVSIERMRQLTISTHPMFLYYIWLSVMWNWILGPPVFCVQHWRTGRSLQTRLVSSKGRLMIQVTLNMSVWLGSLVHAFWLHVSLQWLGGEIVSLGITMPQTSSYHSGCFLLFSLCFPSEVLHVSFQLGCLSSLILQLTTQTTHLATCRNYSQ